MRNTVASRLVRHDLPGFTTVTCKQPPKKTLGSRTVPSGLQKHIDHFIIRVNRSPQVLLLAPDLDEDFVNEKCIAKTLVPTLQALGIFGSKLIKPQTNGFITYNNASFNQQIFDISIAQVEAII
jgi:hypothetical protein